MNAKTEYPLSQKLRDDAEPIVARFIKHEDSELRYIALCVFGLHWDLRSHLETYRSMLFDDPDEEVRRMAAGCLGFVLRESRDWDATKTLLRKVKDINEDPAVREFSHMALLVIWFGDAAEHKFLLRVLNAERVFDEARSEAESREDWDTRLQLGEQASRVWEGLVDADFIAALERGEEP